VLLTRKTSTSHQAKRRKEEKNQARGLGLSKYLKQRKYWNPPPKKKRKYSHKPKPSEQEGMQQPLHHPHARHHEDRDPTSRLSNYIHKGFYGYIVKL
jgi:hypothetical protein